LHDVDPADAPDMLVLDLRVGRVVSPKMRYGRAEQALLDVSRPVRVRRPPRVTLDDRRHRGDAAAEPRLQSLVTDLRLDQIFQKVLGHGDVLCPLWDQAAGAGSLARHR